MSRSPDAPDSDASRLPSGGPPASSSLPVDDLARLIDSGPFGYIASDERGRIARVNTTMSRWLGHGRDELVGKRSVQQLLAPGDRIYYDTHVRPLLHLHGEVKQIAVELVRADGERIPVLINTNKLVDSRTESTFIETLVFDATMRRQYEQELVLERRSAERSESRVQLLYEVVSGLAAAVTVDDVAEVITLSGANPFAEARCNLWLIEPDLWSAVRLDQRDADDEEGEHRFFPEGGPALDRLVAGELVVIADRDECAATFPLICSWLDQVDIRSAVIAPMRDAARLIGVLAYGFDARHDFDDDEQRAVASLGLQTEQAIRRARLYEAQIRSRERLESLHRFTTQLSELVVLDDVIAVIARSGVDLLGAKDIRMLMLDESGADVIVTNPVADGGPAEISIPLSSNAIGCAAIRERELITVATRGALARSYPSSPMLTHVEVDRVTAVPLWSGDAVVGSWVLGFAGREEEGENGTLVRLFAEEASHAIGRAIAHEAELAGRRRADLRRAMSEALNGAATTADVGQALTDEGRSAFGADGLALFLLDDDGAALTMIAHTGLSQTVVERSARVPTAAAPALVSPAPVFAERPSTVDETLAGLIDRGHWGAAAVLPLTRSTQVIGLLVVVFRDPAELDSSTKVALSGVAAEASVAISRAMVFDLEHEVAVTLQRSLLSGDMPTIEGWRFDTWHSPSHEYLEVGGDLFDVTVRGDGTMVVIVGDVVGHGLEAAASLGQLRSASKALSLGATSPALMLERLDEFARLTPGVMFASVCCALIASDGHGRYACAGHPYPVLASGNGRAVLLTDGRSSLLGAGDGPRVDAEITIDVGGALVVYTDGLVERRDAELLDGIERLRKLVERTEFAAGADHARQIGVEMLEGYRGGDDTVVVCVTRTDPASGV